MSMPGNTLSLESPFLQPGTSPTYLQTVGARYKLGCEDGVSLHHLRRLTVLP